MQSMCTWNIPEAWLFDPRVGKLKWLDVSVWGFCMSWEALPLTHVGGLPNNWEKMEKDENNYEKKLAIYIYIYERNTGNNNSSTFGRLTQLIKKNKTFKNYKSATT